MPKILILNTHFGYFIVKLYLPINFFTFCMEGGGAPHSQVRFLVVRFLSPERESSERFSILRGGGKIFYFRRGSMGKGPTHMLMKYDTS